MNFVLILISGYLIGSLSSAYLATRLTAGIDLRRFGTGNIGISNMWQATRRRSLMLPVLVWDIGKGWLPLYFGTLAGLSLTQAGIVVVATLIGHNWPFYLGFRGGRGMLTSIGTGFALPVLYGFNPPWPMIFGFGLFWIVTAIARGTPIGALIGVAALPVASAAMGYPLALTYGFLGMFLVMLARRLLLRRNAISAGTPLWKVLVIRLIFDRDIVDRYTWVNGTNSPERPLPFRPERD
jgi:glycerol-3-phosphate acyltransferase PlsY